MAAKIPTTNTQAAATADYLRSLGVAVDEMPSPSEIVALQYQSSHPDWRGEVVDRLGGEYDFYRASASAKHSVRQAEALGWTQLPGTADIRYHGCTDKDADVYMIRPKAVGAALRQAETDWQTRERAAGMTRPAQSPAMPGAISERRDLHKVAFEDVNIPIGGGPGR